MTVDIADTMMTENTGIVVTGIVPGLAVETITGGDRPRDTAAETMIITDTDGWNVPTPQAHADAILIVTGTERTMIVDTNLRRCSLDSKRIEAINNDCPRTFGEGKSSLSNSCDNLNLHPRPLTYSSSWAEFALSDRSGMAMMLTTILVQPVKCCVRCPLPVSGLYCSQAKPVFFHSRKTFSTKFFRSCEYISRACSC